MGILCGWTWVSRFAIATLLIAGASAALAAPEPRDVRRQGYPTRLLAEKALADEPFCRVCPCPIVEELGSPTGKLPVYALRDTSTSVIVGKVLSALNAWTDRAVYDAGVEAQKSGVTVESKHVDFELELPTPLPTPKQSAKDRYSEIDVWLSKLGKKHRENYSGSPGIILFSTDGHQSSLESRNSCTEKNRKRIRDVVETFPLNLHLIFLVHDPLPCTQQKLGLKAALCGDNAYCDALSIPADTSQAMAAFNTLFMEHLHAALTEFVPHVTAPDPLFDDVVLIGRDGRYGCSGVAVGEHTVLTAGHCLPATHVRTGESTDEHGRAISVIEAVHHPDPREDLGLLHVGERLHAAIKSRRRATDHGAPSAVLRYVGFGAIDPRGQGGFGHKKMLDIPATGWGCNGARVATSGCREGFELVLPGSAGRDTCSGDSGGPVYELLNDGIHCRWRLVAVTSRRVADAAVQCGSGGIYERVDAADEWITTRLKQWEESEKKQ